MTSQIKNIALFGGIAAVLIFAYFFFIKGDPEQAGLVATTPGDPFAVVSPTSGPGAGPGGGAAASAITGEFLSILSNIRTIQLDDGIFKDPAFISLKDSSIVLIQDSQEGRPNPFAPIGTDARASQAQTPPQTSPPSSPGSTGPGGVPR